MKPRCICGCGKPAANRHHAIYAQHVELYGGSVKDKRNLVPMAFDCHLAHHGRSRVLPLARLPDSVYEFAVEMMGPGLAHDYLRRYYRDADPRLDALLAEA